MSELPPLTNEEREKLAAHVCHDGGTGDDTCLVCWPCLNQRALAMLDAAEKWNAELRDERANTGRLKEAAEKRAENAIAAQNSIAEAYKWRALAAEKRIGELEKRVHDDANKLQIEWAIHGCSGHDAAKKEPSDASKQSDARPPREGGEVKQRREPTLVQAPLSGHIYCVTKWDLRDPRLALVKHDVTEAFLLLSGNRTVRRKALNAGTPKAKP
jgi:hypothetical protein